MARLVHVDSGLVVNVSDEKADRFDAAVWKRDGEAKPTKAAAPPKKADK